MSKYVKNLVTGDIKNRLEGVADAILVNVIGMDSASTFGIRKKLRSKGINMLVIKSSLAARATDGTSLRPMFNNQSGSLAVVWVARISLASRRKLLKSSSRKSSPSSNSRAG